MSQFNQNYIIRLIDLYGLELDDHQVDTPIVTWLQHYDPAWIVKAIVESLYRGRYKIKSVDRILKDWQRLGKPLHSFTPDYEREILQNLPDPAQLAAMPIPPTPSLPIVSDASLEQPHSTHPFFTAQSPIDDCENLNPEESIPFGRHFHSHPARQDTYSGGDSAIATNLEYLSATETTEPESDRLAGALPEAGDHLQQQSDPNRELQVDAPVHRINSQPVKHHLFATLKAIVDPNHQQGTGTNNSVSLPLFVVNPNAHQIKQFKLPIENLNEEQCL
jgi:hypothetical protein